MKKLLLAVAAFSAFALYSFSTASKTEDVFQTQCTNAAMIQPYVVESATGGPLTFYWDNSSLIHDTSLTFTSRIELRAGTGCPGSPSPAQLDIDSFNRSSYFKKYGVGGCLGYNCFEYRFVVEGYKKALPWCYTATDWIAYP